VADTLTSGRAHSFFQILTRDNGKYEVSPLAVANNVRPHPTTQPSTTTTSAGATPKKEPPPPPPRGVRTRPSPNLSQRQPPASAPPTSSAAMSSNHRDSTSIGHGRNLFDEAEDEQEMNLAKSCECPQEKSCGCDLSLCPFPSLFLAANLPSNKHPAGYGMDVT